MDILCMSNAFLLYEEECTIPQTFNTFRVCRLKVTYDIPREDSACWTSRPLPYVADRYDAMRS